MRKLIGMMLAVGIAAGMAYAGEGTEQNKADKEKSMQAKSETYEKYAQDYEKRAEKALAEGKSEMAKACKKCAAAKRKMAKGYAEGSRELLAEAGKEYSAARDELKKCSPMNDKASEKCGATKEKPCVDKSTKTE